MRHTKVPSWAHKSQVRMLSALSRTHSCENMKEKKLSVFIYNSYGICWDIC